MGARKELENEAESRAKQFGLEYPFPGTARFRGLPGVEESHYREIKDILRVLPPGSSG